MGGGEEAQPPRALLGGPSSPLSLPSGDGGGHAARGGAGAPFLHGATSQNPSQQLPRGWAEGQGSILTSPPGRAPAGTQWGHAQPREADGGEEELHGGEGRWGAAGHTATRRVWLYHHQPEVRAGGRMKWGEGCGGAVFPPPLAVMVPWGRQRGGRGVEGLYPPLHRLSWLHVLG